MRSGSCSWEWRDILTEAFHHGLTATRLGLRLQNAHILSPAKRALLCCKGLCQGERLFRDLAR